mgnify:CR=1 FL=1
MKLRGKYITTSSNIILRCGMKKMVVIVGLMLCFLFSPSVQADEEVQLGFECPHIVEVGDTFDVKVWLDPNGQPVDAWVVGEVRYSLMSAIDVEVLPPWRKSYSTPGEILNSAVYNFQGSVRETQAFVMTPVSEKTEIMSITFVARATGRVTLRLKNVDVAYSGDLYDEMLTIDVIDIKTRPPDDGNYNATDDVPPVAILRDMGNATFMMEDDVEFSSTSYDMDGFIDKYHWDFGDGNRETSSNRVVRHAYTSTGNFTVSLTVTDNSGLSDATSTRVTIYTLPQDNDTGDDDTGNGDDDVDDGNVTDGDNGNVTDGNVTKKDEFDYLYVAVVILVGVGIITIYAVGKKFQWWK